MAPAVLMEIEKLLTDAVKDASPSMLAAYSLLALLVLTQVVYPPIGMYERLYD